MSALSGFVRTQALIALAVALLAGLVLGLAGGYAYGAHRETQKRESCQALVKALTQERSDPYQGTLVGEDSPCFN